MDKKRIWISADHGMAVIYFLQSGLISTLLEAGVEVVILTDDSLIDKIKINFAQHKVRVEGLLFKQAREYELFHQEQQWWLNFLRRVGSSAKINIAAQSSYIRQVAVEESNRRRMWMPLAWLIIAGMRISRPIRNLVRKLQARFIPPYYDSLFSRLPPDLVITATPGWRYDRYLLRVSNQKGIPTASAIVGWDPPSSYGLPGAEVDFITCWSNNQKQELVDGSDWKPDRVNVGGVPAYDGYLAKRWIMPREDYFRMHGLDPKRKLISYAASFVSFSPNFQNIQTLADLINQDALIKPAQLLVRLHPNHFWNYPLYQQEADAIRELGKQYPHIHVVEPVPLGGELGYYSGEDMPEKSSMMAYSDVFTTVYSTMVVEAAIHGCPIVSICIDQPGGWNTPRKYSLALSKIGNWPTHQRFRASGAGKVVVNKEGLCTVINHYLQDEQAEADRRRQFVIQECTYVDGSAGKKTAEFFLSIIGQIPEHRSG
ncbi:MAG: hypothetical protein JW704_09025 [Anaerolineaceae bacterium]|nr:hypothetical protein [Anaerolineaceae bacterium]